MTHHLSDARAGRGACTGSERAGGGPLARREGGLAERSWRAPYGIGPSHGDARTGCSGSTLSAAAATGRCVGDSGPWRRALAAVFPGERQRDVKGLLIRHAQPADVHAVDLPEHPRHALAVASPAPHIVADRFRVVAFGGRVQRPHARAVRAA